MALEPVARQPRHFVQRSRFFEQVRCSGHDHKPLHAEQLRQRFPVKIRVDNPNPELFRVGTSAVAVLHPGGDGESH